jgi:hypothetical protein
MPRALNVAGVRTGKIVFVRPTEHRNQWGGILWVVRCDCGNSVLMLASAVSSCTSCGCMQKNHPNYIPVSKMQYAYWNTKNKHRKYSDIPPLTYDQFVCEVTKPCHYCGTKASLHDRGDSWNGLDRVDNNLGYHVWNVVSCCYMCNSMKSDFTQNEFLEHAKRIAEYQE